MKKSRKTKRVLIPSILAVILCVAMLVGTTFAWFTDTASTSVNKIQAGELKVGLQMEGDSDEWTDAENQTLKFKKAADGATQEVLWEPGCTYELPAIRVVNNGNLAFKYKFVINGIDGDAKLLKAIDFTVTFNGAAVNLDTWEGKLLPTGAEAGTGEEAGTSSSLVISGHMKEDAGNEYQGLSIEGISVTVYAAQYTYEFDSSNNQYDLSSMYVFDDYVYATQTVGDGETTINGVNITATLPAGSLASGVTNVALIKKPTANPDSVTVKTGESALTTDVKIINTSSEQVITANEGTYFTIAIQLGQVDLQKFYHKGEALDEVTEEFTKAGQYKYDFTTGVVTFTTDSFSTFTAVFKFAGGDGTENTPYLIATKEHFQALNDEYTNNTNKFNYYKIIDGVSTLDLSDVGKVNLYGVFDGNNATITTNQRLFNIVGVGSGTQNTSVIKNLRAEVDHSGNALVFTVGSPEITFDNVRVSGVFEGNWNMAAFVNYGSENYDNIDNTGFDYTLNFTNCSCDAKIYSKQNGDAAVLVGHSYSTPGKATITVDSSTKEAIKNATIYTAGDKPNGYLYCGIGLDKVTVYVDEKKLEDVTSEQVTTVKAIPKTTIVKGNGAYTLTPADDTKTVKVTITAQLTAYDTDNTVIPSEAGITFTLRPGTTYTAASGEKISLFGTFDAVEIKNELTDSGTPEYKIVTGDKGTKTLEVYTNSPNKYLTGAIRITATQYDAEGNVSSAGTKEIAKSSDPPKDGSVTWTVVH